MLNDELPLPSRSPANSVAIADATQTVRPSGGRGCVELPSGHHGGGASDVTYIQPTCTSTAPAAAHRGSVVWRGIARHPRLLWKQNRSSVKRKQGQTVGASAQSHVLHELRTRGEHPPMTAKSYTHCLTLPAPVINQSTPALDY